MQLDVKGTSGATKQSQKRGLLGRLLGRASGNAHQCSAHPQQLQCVEPLATQSAPAATGGYGSSASSSGGGAPAVLRQGQGFPAAAIDLGFPRDLEAHFRVGVQLGKGGNGIVRLVYHKQTGAEFACKSIHKVLKDGSDKKKAGHLESLKREISVLKKLKGNLNIIELEAVYEDDEYVHIVQEYCSGGELSFAIGQRHHSERTVASYMRAVLRTLAQCHAHHILHRDIKPGNFMLLNSDQRAPLRAIDFGLAVPYNPEDLPLSNLGLEGTPWFMAPEVLSSQVTPASDVWSAGVMAFQLMTGRMPFDDHKNPHSPSLTAIWRSVLSDKLDFNKPWWAGISPEAKDFVAVLLNRDPAKRPTAKEALKHPFLQGGDSRERSMGKQLQQSVVARIQRYAGSSNFKRSVLQMIASELLNHPELVPQDTAVFNDRGRAVVANPSAACLEPLYHTLQFDESEEVDTAQVAAALHRLGFRLNQSEIARLLEQLDPGFTGKVARTAFAASQVDWRYLQMNHKEAWLALARKTFAALDVDHDGVLRVDEMLQQLEKSIPGDSEDLQLSVQQALEEAGQPAEADQGMDFNDFMQMLKASSVDSLDMYDERFGSTWGASVDKLNALLHRASSLGSSHHGASLVRAAADDSNHSNSTALTDRTNHPLFDADMSQHGDASKAGNSAWGGAWRFDVGTGVPAPAASAQASPAAAAKPAPAWRFDVAGPGSGTAGTIAEAAKPPAATMFRFDVAGPQSHLAAIKPAAASMFRFDVAGPQSHLPAAPAASNASAWRFDVAGPGSGIRASEPAAERSNSGNNLIALALQQQQQQQQQEGGSGRLLGGGHFDRRHHGSSLYKNSLVCRVAERSVHGPARPLETVQE